MIACDEDGFLIGTKVAWQKSVDYLGEIRDGIRAMRGDLARVKTRTEVAGDSGASGQVSAQRRASATRIPVATPMQNRRQDGLREPRVVVMPEGRGSSERDTANTARDASGRFAAKGGKPGKGDNSSSSAATIATAIKASVLAATHNIAQGDIDPTITLGREIKGIATGVRDVVSPLGRGFGKIFGSPKKDKGGESKTERKKMLWFKRIFTELRGLRVQDMSESKAQLKALKKINGNPSMPGFAGAGGEDGGGSGGGGYSVAWLLSCSGARQVAGDC
jgi:hypothetical protein